MNLLRSLFSTRSGSQTHARTRHNLATNKEFQAFFAGESMKPPPYYHEKVKKNLGAFYEHLPRRTKNYLEAGDEYPNSRQFRDSWVQREIPMVAGIAS